MKITAAINLIMILLLSGAATAATQIKGLRVWPAPDHTRIVFDLEDRIEHKIFTLKNPDRLVIDLRDIRSGDNLKNIKTLGTLIKHVRYSSQNDNDLRIVFDLNRGIKPRSFQLTPNQQYGHRLVVDLYPLRLMAGKPSVTKTLDTKRKVVIAIDPGHGGDDPGAIGAGGIQEKAIVLAIAKELNKLFLHQQGFKPVLVRDSDYYVGLRKRTDYARKHKADLLISIHADAFKGAQANGASVYAVSKRGATSEAARWLAESENRADLIGGVGGVSLDDKDDMVAGVLLDLSMTASMRTSLATGNQIVRELGRITRLHKKKVEQAGFVVLKSPDIPSILVETGFISNPKEAKKLRSKSYQRSIAHAIYKGINRHFTQNPPPGTWLAWKHNNANHYTRYQIARGDTLSQIARRNHTSTAHLKQVNALKSDKIRVGQVIHIPTS